MRYHMVVLSMPRKGIYLCLHKHGRPELCKWTAEDRDSFMRVRDQIQALYEAGPVGTVFSRPEVELLHVPGLTPAQAVARVLPYYAEATPPNQKRVYYIDAKESDVEIIGDAGTEGEANGVRTMIISKGSQNLNLIPPVLDAAGNPDISTVEGRASRRLAEIVGWHEGPCTTEGNAKLVVIPGDRKVRVSRTHQGEFVTEIPEVWA